MKWDKWVGTIDGQVLLKIKYLVYWAHRRIDLHCIEREDEEGQFHSHPAYAIRIILWGGYIEELYRGAPDDERATGIPTLKTWRPGRIGLVSPHYIHRIAAMLDGPSYSLWIRGRIIAPILLLGWGWPSDKRGRASTHVEA